MKTFEVVDGVMTIKDDDIVFHVINVADDAAVQAVIDRYKVNGVELEKA